MKLDLDLGLISISAWPVFAWSAVAFLLGRPRGRSDDCLTDAEQDFARDLTNLWLRDQGVAPRRCVSPACATGTDL